MSNFSIERRVPIPDAKRGQNVKYPWSKMTPGDSFFVAAKNGETPREVQRRMAVTGGQAARRRGLKCVTRTDRENNGVRVWLVEPEEE